MKRFLLSLALLLPLAMNAQTPWDGNLSTVTTSVTAQDGTTITGTLANNVQISIAAGATVTLDGASINANNAFTSGSYAGLTCNGSATIILKGANFVHAIAKNYPGIYIPADYTLTIQEHADGGSLEATANLSTAITNSKAAGIGTGSSTGHGGNILIESGTIYAQSVGSCAAIGAGDYKSCGTITITGGNVTVVGSSAAGIGAGDGGGADCGDITVSGGTVHATGGKAGIGSGRFGDCGNITISGGNVTAVGGTYAGGAGIGAGTGNCGNILISGGVIHATSLGSAAAIGAGSGGSVYQNGICGTITIESAATVTAINEGSGNAIGRGPGTNNSCGTITINGHTLTTDKIANDFASEMELSDDANNNKAVLTELVDIPFTQVTINRVLYRDGYFSTLCLPFDLSEAQIAASELAECELYSFGSAEYTGTTLKLGIVEETSIEAGKPYLIRWTTAGPDITALNFGNVTITASEGTEVAANNVKFVGTIGRVQLPHSENYLFLGAQDVLKWSAYTDASSMKGFRAYFNVGTGANPAQHAPARLVIIPKSPTALENISAKFGGSQKRLENGQLIIIKNGVRYNAQGQIVK